MMNIQTDLRYCEMCGKPHRRTEQSYVCSSVCLIAYQAREPDEHLSNVGIYLDLCDEISITPPHLCAPLVKRRKRIAKQLGIPV